MTPKKLFAEIRAFCKKNENPANVARYSRYFKEGYDAYGLSHEQMMAQKDVFLKRLEETWNIGDFLDLGDLLVATGKYEEASFALLFAADMKDQWTPAVFDRIGIWLEKGIGNWGHTDFMSGEILSPFILKGIVPYKKLGSWRKSDSKWKRRSVPVSLIKVMKKGQDPAPLLEFIRPLMTDSERVVHQGVGWFLREAWKLDPKPVEAFLLEWKNEAPRLIFQYATEKMTPVQKARFRKQKT